MAICYMLIFESVTNRLFYSLPTNQKTLSGGEYVISSQKIEHLFTERLH
jgi:hypothetical protein